MSEPGPSAHLRMRRRRLSRSAAILALVLIAAPALADETLNAGCDDSLRVELVKENSDLRDTVNDIDARRKAAEEQSKTDRSDMQKLRSQEDQDAAQSKRLVAQIQAKIDALNRALDQAPGAGAK